MSTISSFVTRSELPGEIGLGRGLGRLSVGGEDHRKPP